ncbi:MAG TPA: hypothetical protein IAC67_01245 [Candidatus Coproplasma excrementipullorum]|nr:hypothetical protein [Candidatus Coproplasma excrementipullorum]
MASVKKKEGNLSCLLLKCALPRRWRGEEDLNLQSSQKIEPFGAKKTPKGSFFIAFC